MSLRRGRGGVGYTSGRQRPVQRHETRANPGGPHPRGQHLPDRGQAAGECQELIARDTRRKTTVCDMNWIEASWPLHGRLTVATIPQRWAELCRSADGCFLGQTHWRQIGILLRMEYEGCRLRPRNAGRALCTRSPGFFRPSNRAIRRRRSSSCRWSILLHPVRSTRMMVFVEFVPSAHCGFRPVSP